MLGLQIEAQPFNYILHYSKRRSLAIQIKAGEVIVRAPIALARVEIEAFLQQKQPWILDKIQASQSLTAPSWLEQNRLPLFEQIVRLELQRTNRSGVLQQQDTLLVNISTRVTAARIEIVKHQLITDWYKQQASVWFKNRVKYWQQRVKVEASDIVIGGWKTKWGYCRADGRLGFNWRLLMAPTWVADYVVVHEVCHLRHLNHSAEFWHLAAKHCADLEQAKLWLKQHQHQLTL
jgi:predicted metal-dependent hydrolase